MGQPVKLSDSLIADARFVAEVSERSIAGQIEFWASLGRAMERLLRIEDAMALKATQTRVPLSECLRQIGSREGQERLRTVLQKRPFPHFEADPSRPGIIVKIDEDGTRTSGQFRNRRFVPLP